MKTYESVKNVFKKTAKGAVKVSGELVEFTKLKVKVLDIKSKIDAKYTSIGKLYYSLVADDADCGEEIQNLLEEIAELKSELETLQDEVDKNKNITVCEYCGAKNSAGASYCNKCGSNID